MKSYKQIFIENLIAHIDSHYMHDMKPDKDFDSKFFNNVTQPYIDKFGEHYPCIENEYNRQLEGV